MRRTSKVALSAALCGALVTGWAQFATAAEPAANLRADVNRDGKIDATDESGEDQASALHGAVFLPNVDDDSRRCKVTGPGGKPLPEAQLVACRDGADTIVNGAEDVKDLAKLRTLPLNALPAGAKGRVEVTGVGARFTRLFVQRAGAWKQLKATDLLTAAELGSGVELGIEGTDVIRDAKVWDGRAVVRLAVTADGKTTTDTVTLRAAPLLTHHHLQRAQRFLVANLSKLPDSPPDYGKESARFVAGFKEAAVRAGVKAPVVELTKYGDIWVQDFFEPMYVSMPAPGGGTQVMRVLFRSHQAWRSSGLELYEKLRGPGVGVIQLAKGTHEGTTLDSMGNMETIPPYSHGGKSYPAGRVIMGQWKQYNQAPSAAVRDMLAAQGLQSPLLLDTSWLYVGHVDEFVQFLPATTPRGWRVAVADPDAGLALLRGAKAAGHGDKRLFSRPTQAPTTTINAALADKGLLADNALAAGKIRENLAVLQRETGLIDSEISRVPALFKGEHETGDLSGRLRRFDQRQIVPDQRDAGSPKARAAAEPVQMSAYIPGAVNGVVLSPTRYLAAKQWGPVIGGKDLFGDAVADVYRKAGFEVDYLDDWMYHLGSGEVHCGTNTLRDATKPWWR